MLREIALAKLEGLTDEEVAERFAKSRKWVQSKACAIRERLRENAEGGARLQVSSGRMEPGDQPRPSRLRPNDTINHSGIRARQPRR